MIAAAAAASRSPEALQGPPGGSEAATYMLQARLLIDMTPRLHVRLADLGAAALECCLVATGGAWRRAAATQARQITPDQRPLTRLSGDNETRQLMAQSCCNGSHYPDPNVHHFVR